MKEVNTFGVSTVFSADADFETGIGMSTTLCSKLDQLSNAFNIKCAEGVFIQDAFLKIEGEELTHVIAREPKGHLRQVIGSKGEELCMTCDGFGLQGCAG